MRDYIRRFLIAIIMALCVSLLFLGGKHSEAAGVTNKGENGHWLWPTDGIITDTYGTRLGKHKGIDIAGGMETPIIAVQDGVVEKSYFSDTYGNVVFIKHVNNIVAVYAHLNKRMVHKGQHIKRGQLIGKMGKTGQATGTHLHFEVHNREWRYDKKFAFNPEKLLGSTEVGEVVPVGVARNRALTASSYVRSPKRGNVRNTGPANQYVVRRGDTLSSIALKKKVPVAKIKKMNGLNSDFIVPNQVLILK